ncbi:benzoate 4-monooxygenase cytochrome P450 [Aspergillus eucalypticola CBS 122712]|uniref:Benzoate 4-monooxygenase cytochrome P450 n=1 Tax=Aspergillus eucalypticola (strain CBS 122712 / IBT 29274) TaxID=1448314 RepID=A0A317V9S8_ASPEC|nr:benzoate 4-monooxygenase cytochrome P450 [Aspergillus eucalypticola CBS 122712]PWY70031.1 benzoate 4-monooxygenase cytochrome P450 [Aspergillus eucalypticola CBS 122712]
MAHIETLQGLIAQSLSLVVVAISSVIFCRCFYRIYLHPLSSVPGPKLAACTSLWLAYHTYIGDECTVVYDLHRKYGPVLRVAPNDVDIADKDALEPIYVARGGFPKTPAYSKFDIDGHTTIFSSLTLPERATRAKAVAPLFSTTSIRNSQEALREVFDDFAKRLQTEARTGRPVNVLNVTRAMAIDAVSTYLFHERYGAITEDSESMSASPFVDSFVGVGAYFNIVPGKIGGFVMEVIERWSATKNVEQSHGLIDQYARRLVQRAIPKSGSYQSRLLEKSTIAQSRIEVKDVCFAGTDSTGMNTATIMWYLAKHPEVYDRLRQAVMESIGNDEDPTACVYLRGVVREGLRLSWANPIRLPRSVPAGGWKYHDYYFPAGTSVGVAAFQLHQDSSVFPEPHRFLPERWDNADDRMLTAFFAFGKGTRACIAQSLAMYEVTMAIFTVVKEDVLRGASIVEDRIEIKEWFNSKVKGHEILIQFASK